ncbi:MAG TPA: hypothetical protein VF682_18660 [Pseudomonas sp.]|jgi:acyl carrier protein
MNRKDIQQHVFDEIGIILVDKSEIREDSSFKDLWLDEDDVIELFSRLERDYNLVFPPEVRERAIGHPEELILTMLVDLILVLRKDSPQGADHRAEKEPVGGKRRNLKKRQRQLRHKT